MKNRNQFSLYGYLLIFLLSSCSSTTMIQTNPSKAKLYIDGAFVGETPYLYSDTKIVGSSMLIKLEKEGFKPLVSTITRDEEVDVGAIIGGIFFTVPFLWTMKYSPEHYYNMVKLQDEQAADSQDLPKPNNAKIEKLRELKTMLDENLISKDEFEKEKSRVLNAEN